MPLRTVSSVRCPNHPVYCTHAVGMSVSYCPLDLKLVNCPTILLFLRNALLFFRTHIQEPTHCCTLSINFQMVSWTEDLDNPSSVTGKDTYTLSWHLIDSGFYWIVINEMETIIFFLLTQKVNHQRNNTFKL